MAGTVTVFKALALCWSLCTVCLCQPGDPFGDLPRKQPAWQAGQSSYNTTLVLPISQFVVRITPTPARLESGAPLNFSRAAQQWFINTYNQAIAGRAFAELLTFKEVFPDPAAPAKMRDPVPSVEVAFTTYYVNSSISLNSSASEWADINRLYEEVTAAELPAYLNWTARLGVLTNTTVYSIYANLNIVQFRGGYRFTPSIVMVATLAVQSSGSSLSSAERASAVLTAVNQGVVGSLGDVEAIGTLCEVVHFAQQDEAGRQLVAIAVTMAMCSEGAALDSPGCEQRALAAALQQVLQSPDTLRQWRTAGIQGAELVSIEQRQISAPIGAAPVTQQQPQQWVPWHLDRIDQRALPLDGRYTATADGTGVSIYIISSGILGSHEEFGRLDGSPGSRVVAGWGFRGLDPLEDCSDFLFMSGTAVASQCCGLQLGPAKNATIYSVRFRQDCAIKATMWEAGALPSAMDAVLSTLLRPAVVLIDIWRYKMPGATNDTASVHIDAEITARLDAFAAANVTVVAGSGATKQNLTPCDNVIAGHPGVISVGVADTDDQEAAFSPANSSCIDIYAPSGAVGTGAIAASSKGPSSYNRIILRTYGGAGIVAGVAAQYLQLHPQAAATEVREALLGGASAGTITGVGVNPPAALLFTNYSSAPAGAAGESGSSSGGGGGLNAGAIVGIVVGAAAVVAVAAAAAYAALTHRRRRRQPGSPMGKSGSVGSADKQHSNEAAANLAQCSSCSGQAAAGVLSVGLSPRRWQRGGPSRDGGSAREQAPASPFQLLQKGVNVDATRVSHSPDSSPRRPPSRSQSLQSPEGTVGSSHQAKSGSLEGSSLSAHHQLLLARLPDDDNWTACIIDYSAIRFCREPATGALVELGRGAFSIVYKVLLDGVLPYAAKVLHLGDNPKAEEMFLKEAALLRRLRHRNIVGFGGVSVHEGEGIILTELLEARDLRAKLQATDVRGERLFAWHRRGRTVALDIAQALVYLHSRNYTHFDVKSSNVLLNRDLTAKLADVGFTKTMRHTYHTMSQHTPGTFDYMAPELLMGQPCTNRVDIYSYGVLMHEICTGEFPVRGCLRPIQVPEEAPQEIVDIYLACTELDPAHRPTAKELVKRLTAVLQLHKSVTNRPGRSASLSPNPSLQTA